MDLQVVHDHIITLARQAGVMIMEYYDAPIEQMTKSSTTDIVTNADKSTEKLIVADLLEHYPDHHIVGEEGGGQGADAETADYFWYVDPIDGTTNFAGKIPHFCTSIALTDRDLNPLVGVVYDPNRDELFSAIKDGGAWCDGEPINVSNVQTLGDAVLVSGFPYDRLTNPDNNMAEWERFMLCTRATRCMGSAALDSCYVAAGRFEGYWEKNIQAWDIAASALVLQEAGGQLSNYHGETPPRLLEQHEILMSNRHVHQEMVKVLTYS
jgi:myo-inositol-1(or 4)-monophosphatase